MKDKFLVTLMVDLKDRPMLDEWWRTMPAFEDAYELGQILEARDITRANDSLTVWKMLGLTIAHAFNKTFKKQWGTTNVAANDVATPVTLPIAFPNGGLNIIASFFGSVGLVKPEGRAHRESGHQPGSPEP